MKKLFVVVGILSMIGLMSFMIGCSRETVSAGNVGILVNLYGVDKGVDEITEVGVGKYWVTWNQELYTFPTFKQNYVWTASKNEGSENDESISFQTSEGLSVSADIGITYSIDPKKAKYIFQKYRKGVNEITDIFLRNKVRDAFNTTSSKYNVESVYV